MNCDNKKTTVLISYNPVGSFRSGWHADNRVFVCANDAGYGRITGDGRNGDQKAGSVMHHISGQFYHGSVPVNEVKRYYVYAGLHAMEQAISMARNLRSQAQAPVTLVACNCDANEKRNLLMGTDITIEWCECGGKSTMGRIAEAASVA